MTAGTTTEKKRLTIRELEEVKLLRGGLSILLRQGRLDDKVQMRAIQLYHKCNNHIKTITNEHTNQSR